MYILPAVPVSTHSRWQKSCLSSPFTPPYTQEFYRYRKGANFCQQMALNTLLFLSLTPMHLYLTKSAIWWKKYTRFPHPSFWCLSLSLPGVVTGFMLPTVQYIYISFHTLMEYTNSYFIYTVHTTMLNFSKIISSEFIYDLRMKLKYTMLTGISYRKVSI